MTSRIVLFAAVFAAFIAQPASAQTAPPTPAQLELKKAQDQLAQDRSALEAARKLGEPAAIKAAEEKMRASQAAADRNRVQADRAALKASQERVAASKAALAKEREEARKDRAALEAARKSGDPARIKAAEAQFKTSEAERAARRKQLQADQARLQNAEKRLERDRDRARAHRQDAPKAPATEHGVSGDPARHGAGKRPTDAEDRDHRGKGKSEWAHSEKKGQGHKKRDDR